MLGWNSAVTVRGWPEGVTLALAVLPTYVGWGVTLGAAWPSHRVGLERRALSAVERGREPMPVPSGWQWWLATLRGRLLFVLVPLAFFVTISDVAALALSGVDESVRSPIQVGLGLLLFLGIGPWLMVRTLPTTRPDRVLSGDDAVELTRFVRRCGLGSGELRIWDTGQTVANALAIGVVRGARYVLVSDVLLRGLSRRQVEAVIAHEAGHLRHRHMLWLIGYLLAASFLVAGPLEAALDRLLPDGPTPLWVEWTLTLGSLGVILAGLSILSRLFERHADAHAAAVMERVLDPEHPGRTDAPSGSRSEVGDAGAWVLTEALRSAVRLAGGHDPALPPASRSTRSAVAKFASHLLDRGSRLVHPSYAARADHLRRLAQEKDYARQFRFEVAFARATIVVAAVIGIAFVI
jgi:STE24 endopeptidase